MEGLILAVVGSVWSNAIKDNDGITLIDMVGTIVSGIKFEPQNFNETTNGEKLEKN